MPTFTATPLSARRWGGAVATPLRPPTAFGRVYVRELRCSRSRPAAATPLYQEAKIRAAPRLTKIRAAPRLAKIRAAPRLAKIRAALRLAKIRAALRLAKIRAALRLAKIRVIMTCKS
jgi:hypothetical protein